MPKESGFTLIELLVVISIIAILSAVGLVTFNGIRTKAQDAKVKADLNAIKKAYEANYDPTANGGQGGYKPLSPTSDNNSPYFADGKIPLQPNGSPYSCGVGPDAAPGSGTYGCNVTNSNGYQVSATLPSNNNTTTAVVSNQGTIPASQLNSCDPGGVLSNGLVGYWKMDETASPFANYSNSGKSATWFGAVSVPNGKFTNASSFNGASYAVNNTGGFLPAGSSPRTITFWFKPNAGMTDTNGVLGYGCSVEGAGCADSGVGRYIGPWANTTNIGIHTETCGINGPATPSAPADGWYLYTAIFNGDNSVTFYINGGNKVIATPGCTINTAAGNGISIGVDRWGYYNGLLDDIRIYSRALTSQEVTTMWNNGTGCAP